MWLLLSPRSIERNSCPASNSWWVAFYPKPTNGSAQRTEASSSAAAMLGPREHAVDQSLGQILARRKGFWRFSRSDEMHRMPAGPERLEVVGDGHVGPIDPAGR